MLYGANVAVRSQISTNYIIAVWAERTVVECKTYWCIT